MYYYKRNISVDICESTYLSVDTKIPELVVLRELLVAMRLLNQVFLAIKLKTSFLTFYGCHHELVSIYVRCMPQTTTNMLCSS